MGGQIQNVKNQRIEIRTQYEGEKKRWVDYARKESMSLSELIRAAVEQYINPIEAIRDSREVQEENLKLREQIKDQKQTIETLKQAIVGYKREIISLKNKEFATDKMGVRTLNPKLVNFLKTSKRTVKEKHLFEELNINENDVNSVKGLVKQLQLLEDLGKIAYKGPGWRWVENE